MKKKLTYNKMQDKIKQGYWVVATKRQLNKMQGIDNNKSSIIYVFDDKQKAEEKYNSFKTNTKILSPLRKTKRAKKKDRVKVKNGLSMTKSKFFKEQKKGNIDKDIKLTKEKVNGYYRMTIGNKIVQL